LQIEKEREVWKGSGKRGEKRGERKIYLKSMIMWGGGKKKG